MDGSYIELSMRLVHGHSMILASRYVVRTMPVININGFCLVPREMTK